jgi:hypothetical protein
MKLAFTLDKVLRSTVEMCMSATALSLASVMAGSGDLDSLRTLRELRWKVDDVVYGTHMALSMAIGEAIVMAHLRYPADFCNDLHSVAVYCRAFS